MSLAVLETYRGTGDLRVVYNSYSDNSTTDYSFDVEYPFAARDFIFVSVPDLVDAGVRGSGKYYSDARFYVAVSVLTLLYVVVAILSYAFLEGRLKETWRMYFFHTDFVSTVLLAFFWLVASCVWARGASGVSDAVDDIFQEFKTSQNCSVSFVECTSDKPTYGGIIVAVLLGFLNLVLWSGNIWFTFKETHWFPSRQKGESEEATTRGQEEQTESQDVPPFKYSKSIEEGGGESESDPTDTFGMPEDVDLTVPSNY